MEVPKIIGPVAIISTSSRSSKLSTMRLPGNAASALDLACCHGPGGCGPAGLGAAGNSVDGCSFFSVDVGFL